MIEDINRKRRRFIFSPFFSFVMFVVGLSMAIIVCYFLACILTEGDYRRSTEKQINELRLEIQKIKEIKHLYY